MTSGEIAARADLRDMGVPMGRGQSVKVNPMNAAMSLQSRGWTVAETEWSGDAWAAYKKADDGSLMTVWLKELRPHEPWSRRGVRVQACEWTPWDWRDMVDAANAKRAASRQHHAETIERWCAAVA